MKTIYTLTEVLLLLKKKQRGRTLQAFGRECGCSKQYLNSVYAGVQNPGEKLLQYLGLEKNEMTYRVAKP